jgi:hypothetical protein
VEHLLKIEKLQSENNMTLDNFIISYRSKELNSGNSYQITLPVEVRIESQKFLNVFLVFIQENKELLKEIRSREISELHDPNDKSFTDSRNYFKNLAGPILKKFFDCYLAGQISYNEISFRGGLVLDYLQLLNFKIEIRPTGTDLRTKLVSNFKSTLKP